MAPAGLPEFPSDLRALEEFGVEAAELADIADLADILNEAEAEGILDLPAEDPGVVEQGLGNQLRDPAIAEWLWLLGYLPTREMRSTSEHQEERSEVLSAIRAFQKDAGLTVDAWVGDKTWKVLKALVTFEAPTDVRRYWEKGEPLPALARAVRLRLWALGCMDTQPDISEASGTLPRPALWKFLKLASRFSVLPYTGRLPDEATQVELLFDHSRITGAVAAAAKKEKVGGSRKKWVFSYLKETRETRAETDPEVERFLTSLAKIELWLLGFDVDISPTPDYPVYRFRRDQEVPRDTKLRDALKAFWEMLGVEKRHGHLRQYITPDLFKAFENPVTGRTAAALQPWRGPDFSRALTERFKTTDLVSRAWEVGRGVGIRIWDGLKRLWRWVKRGIRKIVEIGKNAARGFFRFASTAYTMARRAIKAVRWTAQAYARKGIVCSGRPVAMVERDGDVRPMLHANAAPEVAQETIDAIRYFGEGFRLAAAILRFIIQAIRDLALRASVPLVGWARFVWLLVESYQDVRPLYLSLRQLPEPAE